MLVAAGFSMHSTTVEVQAARNGFRTIGGNNFIITKWKKSNRLTHNRKINIISMPKPGVMYKGWYKISNGRCRYFDPKTGVMETGLTGIGSGKSYYFDGSTGWAKTGS